MDENKTRKILDKFGTDEMSCTFTYIIHDLYPLEVKIFNTRTSSIYLDDKATIKDKPKYKVYQTVHISITSLTGKTKMNATIDEGV